ncbi:DUF962 domain-containing protein [Pigmentiphaga sp.]|mgnify:CR=1 FL=1|jgi:Predicted membrane protein|uniref:DUF962 domain-containing protein n=1 Tax=Pigmentiphaga sp. TaxID=1977564 RepID=UPI0025F0B095|nr:DUF962 domain-containing protein [Pigmentiphaga sp.]MBX6317552.1 DUF962 domain-containing protein [Pigmentiphaga sp.]
MADAQARPPRRRYHSFDEFYDFYLSEHAHPVSRRMHVAGTSAALALAVLGVALGRPWLFAAAVACGYGLAWAGHFFFEKNRPATFAHPWWSLKGDFRLWAETLTGRRRW